MPLLKLLAAAATVLALNAPVNAAVLYDEAVSGDMASPGSTSVTLAAGSNLVRGSGSFTQNPFYNDNDYFEFVLGAGQTLNSIIYRVTSANRGQGVFFITEGHELREVGAPYAIDYDHYTFDVSQLDAVTRTNGLPLGAGTYSLASHFDGYSCGDFATCQGSWNYEWQFNVSAENNNAVPTSSSLSLAALALGGLAWIRRRNRPVRA